MGDGKLIFKEVYFMYQNLDKMCRSGYKFGYVFNLGYNMWDVD